MSHCAAWTKKNGAAWGSPVRAARPGECLAGMRQSPDIASENGNSHLAPLFAYYRCFQWEGHPPMLYAIDFMTTKDF
jgi:hypothetical protein